MRINWNRAGKPGRWLLLFLPLVAVGVALALMLSLGHQGAQQAAADATSEIEFSMSAPGCTTANAAEADTCTFPVGASFNVEMFWNGFSGGHVGDAPNVQIALTWGGAVSGPNSANGKSLTNASPAGCNIPVTVLDLDPGGNPNALAVACAVLFDSNIATGLMGTAQFNCDSAGTGTILLLNSNATSLATDAALQPHFEDNAADVLTVNCPPPDGQINIRKVNKDDGTSLLAGSCWLIYAVVPLSGNNTLNKPVDIVSDNNAVNVCDKTPGAPFKSDLSDSNPADGLIAINISGPLQNALGTNVFHFEEVKAPDKYEINDSTKYTCTFTDTTKTANPAKVGCDEDGGGSITIANQRIAGNINITFNDHFGEPVANQCVNINDAANVELVKRICDGDPNDNARANSDGKDGVISVTLPRAVYWVDIVPKVVELKGFVPKLPFKVLADIDVNEKVSIKFDFNPSKPFFEKKKTLANLFLTAQGVKLEPNVCEESTDVAIFRQQLSSAPASQNEKGDPQDVRAFEYEIRFDGAQVCVSWTPGKFVANNGMTCSKTFSEEKGLIQVGCVTQKTTPQAPIDNSNLELGVIEVRAQPSLYSIIRATQDNGVVVQIRNDQCNLADLQGHPIISNKCPDADLTIRRLEADVNGDCIVDTADQQLLAFRWGVHIGLLVYNPRFDLVGQDNVINIKDVQFVFGRHNSKCDQFNNRGFAGPTNPPQPPVNKQTASP